MTDLYRHPDPPIEISSIEEVAYDAAFEHCCLLKLQEFNTEARWAVGKKVLTQGLPCGLVLRVDLDFGSNISVNAVNRAICWFDPDGNEILVAFAFGQKVQPLA